MRFTEDHDLFRKMVRDVVDREINPHVDEWEAAGRFPAHELFPVLGAAGLLGLEYDPAYGGQGADHSFTVVYGEEIGRIACGGVPMAISVQTDMATPSLHRYGSEELKQQYLVPAVAGTAVAAIAVTEADAGSDVAGLRTRARRDGDEWVIDGTQALHHQRSPGRLGLRAGPHCRRGGFGRDLPDHRAHGHPGLLGQPHPRQVGRCARRTPRSWCSTACGCRPGTSSARRDGASSSRWSSSSRSG